MLADTARGEKGSKGGGDAEGVSMAMKLLNTSYVNEKTLAISRGHIFGELKQLSHVPVDLFRRFATKIGLAGK